MKSLVWLLALVVPVSAAEGLIALVDLLDEPEGYCLDVPGWGNRLNLNAPLMAHTCKPGAEDELFTRDHPSSGQLYMNAYGRCVAAASGTPGSQILLVNCEASALQRFSFDLNGQIRLDGSDVCITVAGGKGTPTRGPSHLRRDLSLTPCKSADPALSRWRLPAPK